MIKKKKHTTQALNFEPVRDDRIDLWLSICKTIVNMLLLCICWMNMFRTELPVYEDIWFVLMFICLFRLIEGSEK